MSWAIAAFIPNKSPIPHGPFGVIRQAPDSLFSFIPCLLGNGFVEFSVDGRHNRSSPSPGSFTWGRLFRGASCCPSQEQIFPIRVLASQANSRVGAEFRKSSTNRLVLLASLPSVRYLNTQGMVQSYS